MMDPVVSSKFGKRPLLEMPALLVESDSRMEISSLQPARPKPNYGGLPSIVYRPEGLTAPHQGPGGPHGGMPLGPAPSSAPAAMPPIPSGGAGPGPGMFPGPPAGPMYQQPPGYPSQPMMPPQMMPHMPAPTMAPPHMAPPMAPAPMQGHPMVAPPAMPPMQPPAMYPPMQPPHGGYYGGGGVPPQGMMPPYPHHMPPRTPSVPPNFHVEGVLQYGQLTTIHFRDKTSNFRGIPEYLRHELMKTYGKYPVTDIRLVAMNGQIHIYATPRDTDEFNEYGRREFGGREYGGREFGGREFGGRDFGFGGREFGGREYGREYGGREYGGREYGGRDSVYGGNLSATSRKVGFNEVRGEPRELNAFRPTRRT
ncbi:hypothetical protein ACOMHN_049821 [Nucella lapillus]